MKIHRLITLVLKGCCNMFFVCVQVTAAPLRIFILVFNARTQIKTCLPAPLKSFQSQKDKGELFADSDPIVLVTLLFHHGCLWMFVNLLSLCRSKLILKFYKTMLLTYFPSCQCRLTVDLLLEILNYEFMEKTNTIQYCWGTNSMKISPQKYNFINISCLLKKNK